MASLQNLSRRVASIEARNARVERDKAWETSLERRGLILIATYVVVGLFLSVALVPNPWFNALIPSLGFLLSTLSLDYFKAAWMRQRG